MLKSDRSVFENALYRKIMKIITKQHQQIFFFHAFGCSQQFFQLCWDVSYVEPVLSRAGFVQASLSKIQGLFKDF